MIFFILSFLICLVLPFVLKGPLFNNRLYTNKEKPMLLGVSIYVSILIVAGLALIYRKPDIRFLANIMTGSFFIMTLGIVDDIKKLSVREKLFGQIIVSCIVVFLGIRTSIVFLPVWMNLAITVIWIVALVNAFNFLDIMDGLCTGISFIVSIMYLAISMLSGTQGVDIFFWILSGSILAAFVHNVPKARFYLGDSGSMLIGFLFACSTVQISYAPDIAHRLSLLAPLLILFVPIYDLMLTVFMRYKKRIAIFKKSNDHLVLILKKRGFGIRKILTIMYIACFFSGVSALLLKAAPLNAKQWVLVFFAMGVFVFNIFLV